MKTCKDCGKRTDVNFEGVCLECSKVRGDKIIEENLKNQHFPEAGINETAIHTADMAIIVEKMDAQIKILSNISFWIRFWSILSIAMAILYFFSAIISSAGRF